MNTDTPTIPTTRVTDLPRLYATLTKARLSTLVVVTTAVGLVRDHSSIT